MGVVSHFVLALFLCGNVLVGAALLIGHQLPPSADQSALARNPCALPCFLDITVGETSHLEAIERLTLYGNVSAINNYAFRSLIGDSTLSSLRVSVNIDNMNRVEAIHLESPTLKSKFAQLGDLMVAGQVPMHVYHACTLGRNMTLVIGFGSHDELKVKVNPTRMLSPLTPVETLDISTQPWSSSGSLPFPCTMRTDWIGFVPLWKYYA